LFQENPPDKNNPHARGDLKASQAIEKTNNELLVLKAGDMLFHYPSLPVD
jgi:hypothetical protein